jgi:tetratricopeptide (TPR) repeat protein
LTGWLALGIFPAASAIADDEVPLVQRQWFEAGTAHFNLYSCGAPEPVFRAAAQLEQFHEAYARLAGAQAVASPPVVVMVFPDHESLKPFLPLYHGQPENLAGFFQRSDDENLIVLSLPENNTAAMDMSVVFHEYTHLLLRRNDRIWPLWLKEGMAEIYSTFETDGYDASIARPIEHHLRLLANQPMMPLTELFAVGHDSPQYNERDRQGMFYAESWLLTHFLMAGDNAGFKSRFGNFTVLLRAGQAPIAAFTNALNTTLPEVEAELRRYLQAGQFAAVQLALPADVTASLTPATRNLVPVENYFRLGDELLRIGRDDVAEKYFTDAQKLAPAGPLPYEGLGVVAVRRGQSAEAIREFGEAIRRGSASYIAHYDYAMEKFQAAAAAQNNLGSLPKEIASEIHDELLKSIVLMPDFGPSHELFGILEMEPGGNPQLGEQHLQLAVRLEPENPVYRLALAEAQSRNNNFEAARQTLATLLLPTVESQVRAQASELLQKIAGLNPAR